MLNCANCADCPLRPYWQRRGQWSPVPLEENGSDILILGDAPSKQDIASSRPFTDDLGIHVMEVL